MADGPPVDGPDEVVGRDEAVAPDVLGEPGTGMPSAPAAPGTLVVAPGDNGAPSGDGPAGVVEVEVGAGSATWSCHTTWAGCFGFDPAIPAAATIPVRTTTHATTMRRGRGHADHRSRSTPILPIRSDIDPMPARLEARPSLPAGAGSGADALCG